MRWRLVHGSSGQHLVARGDGTDVADCLEGARDAALEAMRHQLLSVQFRVVVENDHGERTVDAPLVLCGALLAPKEAR